MFERFTDRARKAIALGNQEAQRFNQDYIGPEHILLGLIKEGSGVAHAVLKNLDISIEKLRKQVESRITTLPDMVTMGKLPMNDSAKSVLEAATQCADHMGNNYVGTEHLLLGILSVKNDNLAYECLLGLQFDDVKVKAELDKLLGFPTKRDSEHENSSDTFTSFYSKHVIKAALETDKTTTESKIGELFKRGFYLRPSGECKVEIEDNILSSSSYELMHISNDVPVQVYVGSLEFAISESLKISGA